MTDTGQKEVVVLPELPKNMPVAIKSKAELREVANFAAHFLVSKLSWNAERVNAELAFAVQMFDKNPTLMQSKPATIYASLANLGNMGLTLNPAMKQAYLVPRKNKGQWECCLSPSYMGLIKTVTDGGAVLVMEAGLVFEGDDFDVLEGSGGYVKVKSLSYKSRKQMTPEERDLIKLRQPGPHFWDNLIFAYSKAVLHNGAESIDLIPVERLLRIKARCVKDTRDDAVINVHPDEWAKKTVIAHHTKTLPKSERSALAVHSFHKAEGIPDYDNLDMTSERSIFSQLEGQGPVACPECAQECEGGICHNPACPIAEPPIQ